MPLKSIFGHLALSLSLAVLNHSAVALTASNGANARPIVTIEQNVTTAQSGLNLLEHSNGTTQAEHIFPYLLFAIEDKRELWVTSDEIDSTQTGTWDELEDSKDAPTEAIYYRDKFYFFIGSSLWSTDGTALGTIRVKKYEETQIDGTQTFICHLSK